ACVDTASDPKNCGRCEHDCLGGACQSGTCQPIAVASGQGAPGTLRIDANNLYWLNGGHIGQVVKMPLHGGVPTILADAQDFPHSLAIDNSALYWTNSIGGQVMMVQIATGIVTEVARGEQQPLGIAVDSSNIYWTTYDAVGRIRRRLI